MQAESWALLPGSRCKFWTMVVCSVISLVSLVYMASVPNYASPTHFIAAACIFLFLIFAQIIDGMLYREATRDAASSLEVQLTLAYFSAFATAGFGLFVYWMSGGGSTAEWVATFCPFAYFLPWAWADRTLPKESKEYATVR